jgi:hypothetical protein
MRQFVLVGAVCLFTAASASGDALPVVPDADWDRFRSHVRQVAEALAKLDAPLPPDVGKRLAMVLAGSKPAVEEVQELLDPLCLVGVTINPESRVKAARGPATAELRQGRAAALLVKVHNDAGVTHGLTVRSPGVGWLDLKVNDAPPLANTLGGEKVEYVILRLTASQAGKREATLQFDVGQGTQDLGFRAEVPILFSVRP